MLFVSTTAWFASLVSAFSSGSAPDPCAGKLLANADIQATCAAEYMFWGRSGNTSCSDYRGTAGGHKQYLCKSRMYDRRNCIPDMFQPCAESPLIPACAIEGDDCNHGGRPCCSKKCTNNVCAPMPPTQSPMPQPPSPPPAPTPSEQCPDGVYMPGTNTCCAGGVEAISLEGVCSRWIPNCNRSTGGGCCCDKSAMAADGFCRSVCSAAAGCVNRAEDPFKGTGCSFASGDGGGISYGGAALLGAFAGGLVLLGAGIWQRQLRQKAAGAKTGMCEQPLIAPPRQPPLAPTGYCDGGAQRPPVTGEHNRLANIRSSAYR